MSECILVVAIIIAIIMYNKAKIKEHNDIIRDKIKSLNGKEIEIKHCVFSTGPFVFKPKGTFIYKFTYSTEKGDKEGWVRFGSFEREKWIL